MFTAMGSRFGLSRLYQHGRANKTICNSESVTLVGSGFNDNLMAMIKHFD